MLMKPTDKDDGRLGIDAKGKHQNRLHLITGGNPNAPTWKEYIRRFRIGVHPHITAIRWCIEDAHLVGQPTDYFCDYNFETSDGHVFSFTGRATVVCESPRTVFGKVKVVR